MLTCNRTEALHVKIKEAREFLWPHAFCLWAAMLSTVQCRLLNHMKSNFRALSTLNLQGTFCTTRPGFRVSLQLRHAAPQSYSTCINLSYETWTLLWAYERPPKYCEGLHRRNVQPFHLLWRTTQTKSPNISPIVKDYTDAKSNHFTTQSYLSSDRTRHILVPKERFSCISRDCKYMG